MSKTIIYIFLLYFNFRQQKTNKPNKRENSCYTRKQPKRRTRKAVGFVSHRSETASQLNSN